MFSFFLANKLEYYKQNRLLMNLLHNVSFAEIIA